MNIKNFVKYRYVWMTFAIIWTIIFHIPLKVNNVILNHFKTFGYGGVDIFFFASGIGCYLSYIKDKNTEEFYKRRFSKIMPVYWSFIIFWLILRYIRKKITIGAIIGNIFAIQWFTKNGNYFNWYISAQLFLYIITPLLITAFKNNKTSNITFILLLLFSISFWKSKDFIMLATRIPIYFAGLYFGKRVNENKDLNKIEIISYIIAMILGTILLVYFYHNHLDKLVTHGLWWYPFILITPGLCIIISLISDLISRKKLGELLLKPIELLGNNTLEIYLIHVLTLEIYREIYIPNHPGCKNLKSAIILVIITFILTIVFKYYYKALTIIKKKICKEA